MDRFHLSPLNNTYEDIDYSSLDKTSTSVKRRNSESDLLRLVGQELEIINHLIKGHKTKQTNSDVTFSLYEQVEQGFYKCHDSIYDVPEGQRIIPDFKKGTFQSSVN